MPPTRRRTALVSAAVLAAGTAVVAFAVPGAAGAAGTTTVYVPESACSAPAPGHAACFAEKLVKKLVPATSVSPHAITARPAFAEGLNGGYTPGDLASAYGVNAGAATTQTVAIVDAFNDPSVKTDLATFDTEYGLPAETPTSFKVVNQNGLASPLPTDDAGWSEEITLDVQAVRGLCHHCKILLLEAQSTSFSDLGTAVNTAVSMGAKIVSNSYGGPEGGSLNPAYNHHGVAILASTGDDGWYGWDHFNVGCPNSCGGAATDNAPSIPASYNTVIGVGGTSLFLNPDGTRASETVWNDNGQGDFLGFNFGAEMGAAGSGCSSLYAPQGWQSHVSHYTSLGCGSSLRSGVDVAAIADPATGYDIVQTFGNSATSCTGIAHFCWETLGGTSLASPVVAALWALAGGPGGVTYPALSLYGHFKAGGSTYDVTVGGTGLCDWATPGFCTGDENPNNLSRELDCGWDLAGSSNAYRADRFQCYAQPGYDGVSGVGTPKGLTVFKALNPTARIAFSGSITHGISKSFSGAGSTDPFPGGSITSFAWNWGDGHTSTGASASHTYSSKGSKTITLTVTDNYGRKGTKKITVTVK